MIKVHQLVQENKSIHEEAFGLNLKTVFEDILHIELEFSGKFSNILELRGRSF